MDLYLVRHAVAYEQDVLKWPDDRERPLTPDGRTKFKRAADGLRGIVGPVDILLSSPWKRAWDTAEIARKRAEWPAPVACDALQGDHAPSEVVDTLLTYATVRRVAVVGHEPHLHRLAAYLLLGSEDTTLFNLKKGGVARISFEQAPGAGTGRLRWLITPRILRAAA